MDQAGSVEVGLPLDFGGIGEHGMEMEQCLSRDVKSLSAQAL